MTDLSRRDVLDRYLQNDLRNLSDVLPHRQDLMQRVVVDCARHYVDALEFGDVVLIRKAESNLRLAVSQL